MEQSEIDRAIMLFYRSNNSQDFINYVRPAGWLDKLPMKGLSELATLLESARNDVLREMATRPVYNETDLDARDQAMIDAAWKRHSEATTTDQS